MPAFVAVGSHRITSGGWFSSGLFAQRLPAYSYILTFTAESGIFISHIFYYDGASFIGSSEELVGRWRKWKAARGEKIFLIVFHEAKETLIRAGRREDILIAFLLHFTEHISWRVSKHVLRKRPAVGTASITFHSNALKHNILTNTLLIPTNPHRAHPDIHPTPTHLLPTQSQTTLSILPILLETQLFLFLFLCLSSPSPFLHHSRASSPLSTAPAATIVPCTVVSRRDVTAVSEPSDFRWLVWHLSVVLFRSLCARSFF